MPSKILLLPFVILIASGCASLGPEFKKVVSFDKNKALVYMYRVKRFGGAAGSPYVCLDDQVVGETVNGGYFPILIKPGKHKIGLAINRVTSSTIYFDVKAGNTYFLRFSAPMNNGAIESANSSRRAALHNGGGALGAGLMSALGPSSKEKKLILKKLDKRSQKLSINPGLLFVKPAFGKSEIKKTKLFKVPIYKENYCSK